jgi:DNA-binding transcriptional MocR family regulator
MSRIERIVTAVQRLIADGHLAPGQRVDSIREAARDYGVSKNTVVEAYDRLVAQGALDSRAGSGFFVAQQRRAVRDARPSLIVEATDHVSLLREQLDRHYDVRVGDGRPPSDWTERSEIARHLWLKGSRSETPVEHGYGAPQGYEPFRERIAQMLIERAIGVGPDQILTTFGANHGLDLIVRHHIEPGDAVLVDSPGYYPLFGKLRLSRATIVPVLRTPDGPDLDDLEAKAAYHRPKLYFTQTLAHNPTGTTMPLAAMHRLLQASERHGFGIVEDDPFADILPALTPRLATLDQLARVIYVGTFSKTLSASLRSGFLAGSREMIASLTDVKMLSVVNSSGYVERVIHDLMARGHFRRHMRRLQERVARAGETAMAALRQAGFEGLRAPAGGYYLWCPLPEGLNDIELARDAAREGIFLAPSSIFTIEKVGYQPAMRVNVAYADDPRFLDFMARARAGSS